MSKKLLEIKDLYVNAGENSEKEILKGINLEIKPGEIQFSITLNIKKWAERFCLTEKTSVIWKLMK